MPNIFGRKRKRLAGGGKIGEKTNAGLPSQELLKNRRIRVRGVEDSLNSIFDSLDQIKKAKELWNSSDPRKANYGRLRAVKVARELDKTKKWVIWCVGRLEETGQLDKTQLIITNEIKKTLKGRITEDGLKRLLNLTCGLKQEKLDLR
ncbi:MAG: hypothetical protein V1676_07305 [Candidatus Diapherotrites archaeon]